MFFSVFFARMFVDGCFFVGCGFARGFAVGGCCVFGVISLARRLRIRCCGILSVRLRLGVCVGWVFVLAGCF